MVEENEKSKNSKISVRQYAFSPFKYVAGGTALVGGIVIILLSGFIAFRGNVYFDGVIDAHIGSEGPLWIFLSLGFIDWLCFAVPLYFFGLIISKSSFRSLDVFGTVALARWPFLIIAMVMLPEANRNVSSYITSMLKGTQAPPVSFIEIVIFFLASVVTVVMIIWAVILMYKAYAVSCNIKGTKAIITFIVALIGAEIMSKCVIVLMTGLF